MALFQKSVLKSQLEKLDEDLIQQSWGEFKSYFLDSKNQESISNVKEEEFQSDFLLELFDKCLGYTKGFEGQNLFQELKNKTDSKKADGAIKIDGEVICVIELKSTKTKELAKITDQAFGYLNSHPNCKYVVTSNFRKLRFYIQNKTEFEEFDLFNLTEERYRTLWLCLSYNSISSNLPLNLKNSSLVNEEKITKQLYSDYSSFRQELFNDIVKHNPNYERSSILNKTQKLLDRILFILFAEDRGLLPTNTISEIISNWENDNARGRAESLYSNFIEYFNLINTGRPNRGDYEEIFSYNGGLFYEDIELDSLIISNDILLNYGKKLTAYDFESDISVNILGHIFEHSLSEIEELQNKIEGKELDKSKSKRKKDGVFYTPQYITKYIVENTVGKLCEEKKIELNIVEEEYLKGRKGRPKNKLEFLRDILEEYRKWLLELTICDPACGSGAFLNQALEFLISEHNYIDELQNSLLGGGFKFPEVENSILENNLYGVDINKESVEIAKLSLWLRTAQKGRKLTSLNKNIKCGNSLIDDPEVAGEKAFNWQKEFPEVFAKGGFDVIIGNPPYVNVELIPIAEKEFYKITFETFYKRSDLFILFLDLATDRLTKNGIISYIIPSIVLNNLSYKLIRERLLNNKWLSEVCYTGGKVFADATVDTIIITISKRGVENIKLTDALDFNIHKSRIVETDYFTKYQNAISISSSGNDELLNKLFNKNFHKVEDYFNVFQGIVTGNNKSYIFEKKEDIENANIEESLLVPVLLGRDIGKWKIKDDSKRILYINGDTDIDNFPLTKKWLEQFKEKLEKRRECVRGVIPWYSLQWPREKAELDKRPKILLQRTRNESLKTRLVATIDDSGIYGMESIIFLTPTSQNVTTYYFLAILNSKLLNYLFATKFLNLAVKGDYLKQIRFPILKETEVLNELSIQMLQTNRTFLNHINSFNNLLISKFDLIKLSGKLSNWYENQFGDFLKELEIARKKSANETNIKYSKISLSEEAEWMQYFNEQKQKAEELKTKINKTDKEIDQMVYELYGLTKEEIEIVENATK